MMQNIRTTLTLDPDVQALIDKAMRETGLSFKRTVNEAIRSALGSANAGPPFETPTFHMGFNPATPLDKALGLAGELEDEELLRKLSVRK